MNPTTIRIARRLVTYMLDIAEQQVDLSAFMGIGIALAVVFEETTGRSAQSLKPQEIMEWAKNLPDERYPRVTID